MENTESLSIQPKPAKKHLTYIDMAKVIGIILVTFCHIKEKGYDIAYIYSFHLPIFFVIAGVTLSANSEPGEFIWKKIKGYMIPVFFLDILSVLVNVITNLAEGKGSTINIQYFFDRIADMVTQQRFYALWFVTALFVATLIAYFIIRICRKNLIAVIILSAVQLAFAILFNMYESKWLVYNCDVAFFGAFFTLWGYIFRRIEEKLNLFTKTRWHSLIFAIVFLAIGMTFTSISYFYHDHMYLEMWGRQYKEYYLVLPAAFFNSFGVIFFCNTIATEKIGQFAKANLVILALQQELGMMLWKKYIMKSVYDQLGSLDINSAQRYLYAIGGTIFTLILAYSIYLILMWTPLGYCLNQKPFYLKYRKKTCPSE